MTYATHLDLYQLTSLVPHWDAGRGRATVWMSFFSRRLPKDLSGETARGAIIWAGLQRCLTWLKEAQFDEARLQTLCAHPMLGPALKSRPELLNALRDWRFRGEVWAPEEGEILWAGRALNARHEPIDIGGVKPSAMPPYLQVCTDLLTAKLIETPLLSIINHMSMVATKAAHLYLAAGDRSILEFGSRRTHIEAAVDAAVAAYIGGSSGTSNVEANHRYGVPVLGTMDHFAVQSWEERGRSSAETEKAFFRAFIRAYPDQASLLVDTYDMFGEQTGIRNAIRAAQEEDAPLKSIRIDSALTPETLEHARALLDDMGCHQTEIIASGGVDEDLILQLSGSPVDRFGVGERLVSSADAPVGVGAVGKLSWIEGQTSMKRALGSGKATLPGPIQALRTSTHDQLYLVPVEQLRDSWSFNWEQSYPRSCEGHSLLKQVWLDDHPVGDSISEGWLERARQRAHDRLLGALQGDVPSSELSRVRLKSHPVLLDEDLIEAIRDRCSS